MKKKRQNYWKLAGWILACELVGFAASGVTISQIPLWYAGLVKPAFAPPNWVFGPVWTTLYALMGVAAYRIARRMASVPRARACMALFIIQLLFNFVWSFIFFGAHNIFGALVDIAVLWSVLLYLIVQLDALDRTAGLLLVPYMLWVSFAMILNYYLRIVQYYRLSRPEFPVELKNCFIG